MASRASLLLVGRHKLICECLAAELMKLDRFQVAGIYDDLEEPEDLLREEAPDVLLVDLRTPADSELERIRVIARDLPEIKIVVFGLPEVEAELLRCFEAGIRGCIVRDASLEQLTATLDRVLVGETDCSPRIMRLLLARLSDLSAERRYCEQVAVFELSPRELEILTLIADGQSNRQIAESLCLSLFTVKNHVHNILEKLEVKRRHEAVEKAFERGWLRTRRRRRRPVPRLLDPLTAELSS